jgi:hypothetical protein
LQFVIEVQWERRGVSTASTQSPSRLVERAGQLGDRIAMLMTANVER